MSGSHVTMEDMMKRREKRAAEQQMLIEKYHAAVISFCMNIPGPVKTTPEILRLFQDGKKEILLVLRMNCCPVLEELEVHEITGDEYMLSVDQKAAVLKETMVAIEESHPLGRLFDIDIIDRDGKKLSRPAYRKCLICGKQAQDCARSRTHTVEEMQARIYEMLSEYYGKT
ncbi:citrate lyase holo-[acyl-carrier protein] synthase [Clostridium sp. AM58-1XD]|nr:citrate lyase holo-[acyl-carrier protein] synthase [Clostridium sp. AM58-1XD]